MVRFFVAAVMAIPCLLLLLPVCVVVLGLHLFVSCVRAVGRLLEPRFVPWKELMTFDRRLGWKPRPGLDTHYLAQADDVFRVVTDSEGWPGIRTVDESAVIVIGDSFAFGYGVDTGRGFADLNPGLAVKGVGAPGYSMVQSTLLMEQLAERLTGKLVVWFICLENDLEDNMAPAMWRYRSPFIRPSRTHAGWELADEHVTSVPWQSSEWGKKRLFPHLCVPGPLADRAYAGTDYLIRRASESCRRIGAQLAMVTIPDPIQLTPAGKARLAARSGRPELCDENLPDRRLAESCARYGVPMIAGKDHLSGGHYKRREGIHWNEQGHRKVAQVLGQLYDAFRAGELDKPARQPITPDPIVESDRVFASAGQSAVSRGVTNG